MVHPKEHYTVANLEDRGRESKTSLSEHKLMFTTIPGSCQRAYSVT